MAHLELGGEGTPRTKARLAPLRPQCLSARLVEFPLIIICMIGDDLEILSTPMMSCEQGVLRPDKNIGKSSFGHPSSLVLYTI
jgi:hypothetical protein